MTTHPLLEELRALGVQLSTDGVNLNIHAPKGAMTPTLRERLATQKQEIITALRSSEFDERLHAFASTISHIVDVLGGPDHVRISKHEKGLTLEQYTRTIRPSYRPVTLPKLPRSACPFRVMGIRWKRDGAHQIAEKCRDQPLPHGWCAKHGLSNSMLTLGAFLGYPTVALGGREIGAGVAQWEAYAECFTLDHLARDVTSICQRFHVTREKGEWK